MKMQLIMKLRIAALLVAAILVLGGYRAAVHPELKIVIPKPAYAEPALDLA